MLYRELGKTGIRVSALGLGCMRLPTVGGGADRSLPVDEPAAARLIAEAVDLGVTYFDTAYPYHQGTSEAALGADLPKPTRATGCASQRKSPAMFSADLKPGKEPSPRSAPASAQTTSTPIWPIP